MHSPQRLTARPHAAERADEWRVEGDERLSARTAEYLAVPAAPSAMSRIDKIEDGL